jgi:hypothetical protein
MQDPTDRHAHRFREQYRQNRHVEEGSQVHCGEYYRGVAGNGGLTRLIFVLVRRIRVQVFTSAINAYTQDTIYSRADKIAHASVFSRNTRP